MFRSLVILLVVLFSFQGILAQRKHKMKPYYKGRYNAIKIPKSKERIICPDYQFSLYPNQRIGFKLGDPFALSYKVNFSEHLAIGMELGRISNSLYNRFHKSNFHSPSAIDTTHLTEISNYFGHDTKRDGLYSLKLVYGATFKGIKPLKWYIGPGFQYRWSVVNYTYIRNDQTSNAVLENYNDTRYTVGPTLTVGIDYAHPDMPVSSFIEFEGYCDASEYPGWIRLMGGTGLRITF